MTTCPSEKEIPFPPIVGNGMVLALTIYYP